MRASTPSNAAELAVPDMSEMADVLHGYDIRGRQAMAKKLASLRTRLSALSERRVMLDPAVSIDNRRIELDRLRDRLVSAEEHAVSGKKHEFVRLTAALDAMSPLKVLSRGYAIATDGTGAAVKSVKGVSPGDRLCLRFSDGSAQCAVESVQDYTVQEEE